MNNFRSHPTPLHNLLSATPPPLPSARRFFNAERQCYSEMKMHKEPYFSILSSIILWVTYTRTVCRVTSKYTVQCIDLCSNSYTMTLSIQTCAGQLGSKFSSIKYERAYFFENLLHSDCQKLNRVRTQTFRIKSQYTYKITYKFSIIFIYIIYAQQKQR